MNTSDAGLLGWVAGIVDGEGWIALEKVQYKDSYGIGMTCVETIKRLHMLFGFGNRR
jgi:hypothetical protein